MNRANMIVVAVLTLTTVQLWWNWLESDRQFTRLSLVIWLFFLSALVAYRVLLCWEKFSEPLRKVHWRVFYGLTGHRLFVVAILLLAAYGAWYTHHVWQNPLMGKDFGAFYYRYMLLDQLFPSFVGYNPLLNGGYQTTELLTTGSVNLFVLTYPIAALFSVEAGFNTQPILVILLLPMVVYLSGRLINFSHAESFLSAAFALVMTPIGHMGVGHMLFHGTLPYVFSCEIAVIVFALSYRIFVLGNGVVWAIPLVILLGSLAALHPVFFLVMGPVAIATVFCGKIPVQQRFLYSAVIGLGFLAINGNWIYELISYDRGQLVSERIDLSSMPLVEWLEKMRTNFLGFQIPLVAASIIGVRNLIFASEEPERQNLGRLLLFAIAYYALLSSIGYFALVRLQPMRFVVPLSLFLSLAMGPSWRVVKAAWTRMEEEKTSSSLGLNTAILVLITFVCVPYFTFFVSLPTAPPTSYELTKWLRENVNDNDGRFFFYVPDRGAQDSPFGGQIPFYQAKTGRSIMGVPAAAMARKSIDWIQEIGKCLKDAQAAALCRDLYNVRYAVTLSHNGKDERFSQDHDTSPIFSLVKTIDRIRIYEATQPSNYFLIGRGEVKQYLNRLAVIAEPSDVHVLKFFWAPGLRTVPPLSLERYPLGNGKDFIKVHSNFHRNFEIVYR